MMSTRVGVSGNRGAVVLADGDRMNTAMRIDLAHSGTSHWTSCTEDKIVRCDSRRAVRCASTGEIGKTWAASHEPQRGDR